MQVGILPTCHAMFPKVSRGSPRHYIVLWTDLETGVGDILTCNWCVVASYTSSFNTLEPGSSLFSLS